MKRKELHRAMRFSFFSLFAALFLYSCGSVPLTGRKQLLLVSDQEVLTLSLQQYQQFIGSAPVERNTANAQMVTRVGTRIASAVETYLKNNGYASEIQNLAWEFNLVKSNDVNAFCMPGGKIVVYTGILPITRDEAGLATVIGHEVAHAIAKHSNERMSQQVALQYGGAIAGGLLSNSQAMQQIGNAVFGVGAQYGVMLPYARKQEYEADDLGLIFMAMAGYNPEVAVSFWERMSEGSGGGTPEFMSTHPASENRIQNIRKALPTAMKYYTGALTGTSSGNTTKQNSKTSKDWSF